MKYLNFDIVKKVGGARPLYLAYLNGECISGSYNLKVLKQTLRNYEN